MKCPRDGNKLAIREHEHHIGLVCPSCDGIWLPKRFLVSLCRDYEVDFDEVLSALEKAIGGDSELSCAECGETMGTLNYEGIEMDLCKDCSALWLDTGELNALESAMSHDEHLTHPEEHDWLSDGMSKLFKKMLG